MGKQEKFLKRYRIGSIRLPTWDYSSPGFYFVTICTRYGKTFFGYIDDGKMHLSDFGEIAQKYLLNIPKISKNIRLDEFIIMPNHIHMILIIKYRVTNMDGGRHVETLQCNVSTKKYNYNKQYKNNKQLQKNEFMSKISPQSRSLSTVIRSYKYAVTRECRQKIDRKYFMWQPRFHEHIIKNKKSLHNIRRYIKNNPSKWWRDRNNPNKLWM